MKKMTKMVAVLAAISMMFAQPVFAASNSTAPVNISAVVSSQLQVTAVLHQNSSTGSVLPALAFGTLQPNAASNTLRSSSAGSTGTGDGVFMISANSSGLPYTITQTGTTLTNGANTIPSGACTVVPVMVPADNGGAANVGVLGAAGTWVAANKTIYTSDAVGSIRTIQAHYSITDDPAAGATAGVPINQVAGTYNGTVTFTVTA